jgi:hypothetical protein
MTEEERNLVARQSDCIARQTSEIAALKLEIDRLNAVIRDEGDALAHLRKIYSNPSSSTAAVLRACDAAIPYERSRQPVLSVNAGFDLDRLADRLGAVRKGLPDPGDSGYDDAIEIENSTGQ